MLYIYNICFSWSAPESCHVPSVFMGTDHMRKGRMEFSCFCGTSIGHGTSILDTVRSVKSRMSSDAVDGAGAKDSHWNGLDTVVSE